MSKRELIAPKGNKRFARRSKNGRFSEQDDVGKSLAADRKRAAQKTSKPGHGDEGDRRKSDKL